MSDTNNQPTTPVVAPPLAALMKPVSVRVGESGLQLQSYDEMLRFANMISKSTIVPTHFQGKPENCFVALQHGLELGLKPMQTFKSIMVVNGIPSIYGDAALALCRKSKLMDERFGSGGIKEWSEGEGVDLICYCETKRKEADEPHRSHFSWKDALAAGLAQDTRKLYGKYPKRMCGFRARGFELRDNFGDVLLGMVTVEEVLDYEVLNEDTGEFETQEPKRAKFDSNIKVPPPQKRVEQPSQTIEAEYSDSVPSGFESQIIEEAKNNLEPASDATADTDAPAAEPATATATKPEHQEEATPKAKAIPRKAAPPPAPKPKDEANKLPFFNKEG